MQNNHALVSPRCHLSVAVRVRGLLEQEYRKCNIPSVSIVDRQTLTISYDDEFDEHSSTFQRPRTSASDPKLFAYDFVFDDCSTQHDIFEVTALPLVDSLLTGTNATVFAYGATGAGKTYTMIGNDQSPGIMVMTLCELFRRLSGDLDCSIKCSFVEIYNEIVIDLLADEINSTSLDIRDVPGSCETYIPGVTEIEGISRVEDMMELVFLGNQRRTTEPTASNETSSRSHAVLQLTVERRLGEGEYRSSKLSLIDLAGSERAKETRNTGVRFAEAANINRSLLALGNCIKALASDSESFVPYRDSKLTRLLRDSIGGNCRTVMIANVSPFLGNYTDSINTLQFANRAKNIKVKALPNACRFDNSQGEIRSYLRRIGELEGIVRELQHQLVKQRPTSELSSERSFDSDEFAIKSGLMKSISEQIRLRDELGRVESELMKNPNSAELILSKSRIIANLKTNSDVTSRLQASMPNRVPSVAQLIPSHGSISNAVKECCALSQKILGSRSAFQSLSRQPSLVRNKSTMSLRSDSPGLLISAGQLSVEEQLLRLRSDLALIATNNTSEGMVPPIEAMSPGQWRPTATPNDSVLRQKQLHKPFASALTTPSLSTRAPSPVLVQANPFSAWTPTSCGIQFN